MRVLPRADARRRLSFIPSQGSSAPSGIYDDLGLSDLGLRVELWVADQLGSP
jgi:hypothetical protein